MRNFCTTCGTLIQSDNEKFGVVDWTKTPSHVSSLPRYTTVKKESMTPKEQKAVVKWFATSNEADAAAKKMNKSK